MAPKNIKLIHFDARGRVEVPRLILVAAGQKYEDVGLTQEAWQAEKPNTPFGQLPVLEIDDTRYAQSGAIQAYLAREFGFYGNTNLDGLKIDQAVQLATDFLFAVRHAFHEKDEAKKAEMFKNVQDLEVPKYLAFFEKLLKESGTGCFVGNALSLADIFVYDLINNFSLHKLLTTDGYPLLQDLSKKVESNEKIKAYLATRKQTEH